MPSTLQALRPTFPRPLVFTRDLSCTHTFSGCLSTGGTAGTRMSFVLPAGVAGSPSFCYYYTVLIYPPGDVGGGGGAEGRSVSSRWSYWESWGASRSPPRPASLPPQYEGSSMHPPSPITTPRPPHPHGTITTAEICWYRDSDLPSAVAPFRIKLA